MNLSWSLPVITILGVIIVNIILPLVIKNDQLSKISFIITLLGLSLACLQVKSPPQAGIFVWQNLLQFTHWTTTIHFLSLGITVLMIVLMYEDKTMQHGGGLNMSYIFVLVSLLGIYLLPVSQHWLMVYVSITFISVASTMLIYNHTSHRHGMLVSQKYLLYSSTIASGLMLFGISYVYGYTGSLEIGQGLMASTHVVLGNVTVIQISFLFALIGLFMLLGSFPYQFWVADIYTALHCYLVAYLSTITKVAVLGWMVRVLYLLYSTEVSAQFLMFSKILAIIATITMLIGHFAALTTQNIVKLFAYGSIGQTGSLLALLVTDLSSYAHVIYYIIVYSIMNVTSWLSLGLLYKSVNSFHLSDYAGLGKRLPIASICITVSILALIGLPPTAGFVAKFILWNKLWESIQQAPNGCITILLITSLWGTMMAFYYYLKLPYVLFSSVSRKELTSATNKVSFVACTIVVLTCLLIGLVFWNYNILETTR